MLHRAHQLGLWAAIARPAESDWKDPHVPSVDQPQGLCGSDLPGVDRHQSLPRVVVAFGPFGVSSGGFPQLDLDHQGPAMHVSASHSPLPIQPIDKHLQCFAILLGRPHCPRMVLSHSPSSLSLPSPWVDQGAAGPQDPRQHPGIWGAGKLF